MDAIALRPKITINFSKVGFVTTDERSAKKKYFETTINNSLPSAFIYIFIYVQRY